MCYGSQQALCGSTWVVLEEGARISDRVEEDGESADFGFGGPMEVALNLPEEAVRRCRDLFDKALDDMAVAAAKADQAGGES